MDVVTAGAPCQVPVPNQLDRMDNQKLVGHLVGAVVARRSCSRKPHPQAIVDYTRRMRPQAH
jgi:hypothetical protein